MTIDTLYQIALFVLDKEQIGQSFTDDQYNVILNDSQWVIINAEIKKVFIGTLTPLSQEIIEASPLRVLKTTSTGVTVPADYIRFTSLRADYGAGFLPLEPVSDAEAIRRASDVFYMANLHPFCSIAKQTISPVPNNPTVVELNYLQKPAYAYRDYCQDGTTLESIGIPEGGYIINDGTKKTLYNEGGVMIADNVIKTGTFVPLPNPPSSYTTPPTVYYGITVELTLPEESHESILMALLSKCGVNLSAEQVTGYAEAMKKQE